MATSGTVYSGTPASNVGLYGAKWQFNWSASKAEEPGVTNITWTLYSVGKESASSNTTATGYCYLTAYNYNGGTVVGNTGNGVSIGYYDGGSSYISYKGVYRAGGTFQVKHDNEGNGGFSVYMNVNIGGWNTSNQAATHYVTLETNKPYYYIYIDNGTSFVKAIPYIDNGTTWQAAVAHIDTGSTWQVCN